MGKTRSRKKNKKNEIKMTRSKWKGPQTKIINEIKENYSRSTIALPTFLEKTIQVHNGQYFQKIKVLSTHIGYRLGEFVFSRKRYIYKK